MELLSELHGVLSETFEEWKAFISLDADIGYFSDLDEFSRNSPDSSYAAQAGRSLCSIKEAFERLQSRRQKLALLTDDLTKFSVAVRWSVFFSAFFGHFM
jgi:hypothetical protein